MDENSGLRTVKGVGGLLLATANLFGSAAMAAQAGDVFTPYVEYARNYSDNLLRLDDAATAYSRFGSDQLSDTYSTVLGGMRFDKTWGRQQFTADLSANRNDFDRFSQFDYVGKSGQANWNWVLGDRLQGSFSTVYDRSLTPFQDFIVISRSIRTQRANSADLAWLVSPSWRLRTAFSRYNVGFDTLDLAASSQRSDTGEVGLSYLARSGSSIGVVVRDMRGTYATMQSIDGALFNNDYVQKELKLSVEWLITGKTRLIFLGGPVQRRRTYFTARDFTGLNARLTGIMQPTGKLSLNGSVWREIGAVDDLTANYALTDGVSLTPALEILSKLKLEGTGLYQRLDYSGAQVIEGLTPSNRRDTYSRAALSLTYKPWQALSVTAALNREVRDSNLSTFNYRTKGISLKVRYEY